MTSINLSESIQLGHNKVDADKGIIYDVKLLGEVSRNGRKYPRATREAAHGLLEGLKVNCNHLPKGSRVRPIEDRLAKVFGPLEEREDGTYGNLQLIKSHPMAARVLECAASETLNDMMGMSIFGRAGKTSQVGDKEVVEAIASLESIDLVSDPGTTKSLSESVTSESLSEDTEEYTANDHYRHATMQSCVDAIEANLNGKLPHKDLHDAIKHHTGHYHKLMGTKFEDKEAKEEVTPAPAAPTQTTPAQVPVDVIELIEAWNVPMTKGLIQELLPLDELARGKLLQLRAPVSKPKSNNTKELSETIQKQPTARELQDNIRVHDLQILRG